MRHYFSSALKKSNPKPVEFIQLPCYIGTIVRINENCEDRLKHPKQNLCNWKITNANIAINQVQQVRFTYRACRYINNRTVGIQCDFDAEELGKSVFIYDLKYEDNFQSEIQDYKIQQTINYFHETLGRMSTNNINNNVTLVTVKCLINDEIKIGIRLHNRDDLYCSDDCVTISYTQLPKDDTEAHEIINNAIWYQAKTNDIGYYILETQVQNKICDIYKETQVPKNNNI